MKSYLDFWSQIIYKSLQPCSSRGVFSRGEPERPSKVWRPRSGLRSHRGRTRPASLECDPQEQPLLPGPGNNDNKAPVHPKIATTERREAGISVAGNAGLSPRK